MAINELNKEAYRQEYLEFLKEVLTEHCNDDMCCEIYWDYRDEVDPATLKEVADGYKEAGYENPIDYLAEKLLDLNFDYDSYMFGEIRKAIENCENEHVVECFESFGNLREDAYEVGYGGIDVNVDGILGKSEFKVNVMFATDTERDYDMASVVYSFGSWKEPDFDYLSRAVDVLDNAVTYFIHQQGHSVKEVYDCLLNNPRGFGSEADMDFAKAVVNDIVNNSSDAFSELCVLVKLDGNEYFELIEAIEMGETYLSFSKDTMMGIYNEWSGCGGLLEFQLDKPFVVPTSMVRNVQVEGAGEDYGYTVDQVYGLIGSCWKDTLTYTDEAPDLYQENLEATVNDIKNYKLSVRLVDFYKDYDHYDFQDSLNPGETEEDAIARMNEDLESQEAVDSLLERLKDISSDVDLSLGQRREVEGLIEDLSDLKSSLDNQEEIKPALDDVIKSCEKVSNKTGNDLHKDVKSYER